MKDVHVLVLSFGKKSTIKICKFLENNKINYTIVYPKDDIPDVNLYTHAILSGGPKHVYQKDYYPLPPYIIKSNIPVLGICYGMQLIAKTFGGYVNKMSNKEIGCVLVNGKLKWMNRNDNVVSLPKKFVVVETTENGHIASFTDGCKWWAVQYHPESTNCPDYKTFYNFLGIQF